MSPVAGTAATGDDGHAPHAWERGVTGWHIAFALVLLTTLGVTIVEAISPARKAATAVLLIVLAAWYVGVGRAAMRRHAGRLSAAYLAGSLLLLLALIPLTPVAWILLFALCPQSFAALPVRRSTIATVAVLAVAAVGAMSYWSAHERQVRPWVIVGLGLAVFLALVQQHWIERIVAQSRERAELIERLERARTELTEAQRQAGALIERERLASEIHDTLAQGFSSILMLLQGAEFEVRNDPGEAERHIGLARRTAHENLAEARALVAALSPAPLNATALDEALERLVERFRAELPLDADLRIEGRPARKLSRDTQVVLLRTLQEALANVRKHAAAGSVRVRLAYHGAAVALTISDDGTGFDTAVPGDGFGLTGMRRRVEQIGGAVAVESSPGAGTTIRVRVPC
jgi:signal transduction histidine kinase